MPTYHVALSFTRPPNCGDAELFALFTEAVNEAACVAVEISAIGLIVNCDAAAIALLETALRTKLGARGGSLERMIARAI
jgi:hypothetical protein